MGGITLILVFMVFLCVGLALAVTASVLVDDVSENLGILVFFGISTLAVVAAWPLAVRVTEPN